MLFFVVVGGDALLGILVVVDAVVGSTENVVAVPAKWWTRCCRRCLFLNCFPGKLRMQYGMSLKQFVFEEITAPHDTAYLIYSISMRL